MEIDYSSALSNSPFYCHVEFTFYIMHTLVRLCGSFDNCKLKRSSISFAAAAEMQNSNLTDHLAFSEEDDVSPHQWSAVYSQKSYNNCRLVKGGSVKG